MLPSTAVAIMLCVPGTNLLVLLRCTSGASSVVCTSAWLYWITHLPLKILTLSDAILNLNGVKISHYIMLVRTRTGSCSFLSRTAVVLDIFSVKNFRFIKMPNDHHKWGGSEKWENQLCACVCV